MINAQTRLYYFCVAFGFKIVPSQSKEFNEWISDCETLLSKKPFIRTPVVPGTLFLVVRSVDVKSIAFSFLANFETNTEPNSYILLADDMALAEFIRKYANNYRRCATTSV